MILPRITYQNWIVELGHDPTNPQPSVAGPVPGESGRLGRSDLIQLQRTVRNALESLTAQERLFIIRFYFQGQTYRHISRQSGQAASKLLGLHRRAIRKLRRRLAPFVKERFRIESDESPNCPICRSGQRHSIDVLIANRDKSRSWRPVISALKERYSLAIRSPQVLIGHEKYH